MDFKIRPMRPEDISQVSDIEREAFPTTWPPTSFGKELKNHLARYLVVYSPLVFDTEESEANTLTPVTDLKQPLLRRVFSNLKTLLRSPRDALCWNGQLVVGYIGVWFMADEAHITSIAVREEFRRRGLGEVLLLGVLKMAVARRAQLSTLEVRISNHSAQALYLKHGFTQSGLRKRYYSDNYEDALIMTVNGLHLPRYQKALRQQLDRVDMQAAEPGIDSSDPSE
jgi:ribosomal-protein-alanine N-acetyltransferase